MYFSFLRFALSLFSEAPQALSEKEWIALHKWAEQQSLLGVIYGGVQKLPADQMPPMKWALRWSMEAEHIRGLNKKINETTAELSQLFEQHGCRAIVLKGSANALFYPDSSLRQTGDIDFFVPGGREAIADLLNKSGIKDHVSFNSYHASFEYNGEEVEVHFLATRQYSPKNNEALQKFLAEEVSNSRFVPAGFNVPSIPYALMMQLSHIKQHLFKGGVGLRQLVDYHQLLQHSSEEERQKVSAQLNSCGLENMAAAVMFALSEVLDLDENLMLCKPDARRGKVLLKVALDGGNFGWYAEDYKQSVIMRWIKDRVRFVKLLSFDATESIWREIFYWRETIRLIPRRIKLGRLALGNR